MRLRQAIAKGLWKPMQRTFGEIGPHARSTVDQDLLTGLNLPRIALVYAQEVYLTHDIARASLTDYIEVFWNRERIHTSLGNKSPAEFEAVFGLS